MGSRTRAWGFAAGMAILAVSCARPPVIVPPPVPVQALRIEIRTAQGYERLQGSLLTGDEMTVRLRGLRPEERLARVALSRLRPRAGRRPGVVREETDLSARFRAARTPGATATGEVTLPVLAGPTAIEVTVEGGPAPGTVRAAALVLRAAETSLQTPNRRPLVTHPDSGVTYEADTLIVAFRRNATLEDASARLREMDLEPEDWIAPLRLVRTRETAPEDTFDLARRLAGQRRPPVIGLIPHLVFEDDAAIGERMPSRLTETYQGGCAQGGIKGCFERGNTAQAELRIFRYHFFYQSFAGHRLVEHLVQNVPNRANVGIAIVDRGFGDGRNRSHIPDGDFFGFSRAPFFVDRAFGAGANRQTAQIIQINPATGRQECRRQNPNAPFDPNTPFADCAFSFQDVPDTDTSHGTEVALAAAGRPETRPGIDADKVVLGTGPHARLRILQTTEAFIDRATAIWAATIDPDVQVINTSFGARGGAEVGNRYLNAEIAGVTRSILQIFAAQRPAKIWTTSAGNNGECTDPNPRGTPEDFTCPGRPRGHYPSDFAPGPGVARSDQPLIFSVGASSTGQTNPGPERLGSFSNYGPRVSVVAAGDNVVLPNKQAVLAGAEDGTSFAAPAVAGLAAEMLYLDRGLPGPTLGALAIAEIIEATADDLGSRRTAPERRPGSRTPPFENDRPANGYDIAYGHGRINVWKALLAVANRGLAAAQAVDFPNARAAIPGDDTWYGFIIQSPIHGATVWINGQQVQDAPLPVLPVQPNPAGPAGTLTRDLSAYKGVESHRVIQTGIDMIRDGVRDGIVDEDPTRGIVPVGVRAGEFLTAFSIQQRDLTNCTVRECTLSLREPGQGPEQRPFFSLRLGTRQLGLMRGGAVPGVVYDDFVFEITPADFGDAPSPYPTRLADRGARSLNSNLEWLGIHPRSGEGASAAWKDGVSPEPDAEAGIGPDAAVDPDAVTNVAGRPDLDGRDRGVVFFPRTYRSGSTDGQVEFTVCVADPQSPRYQGPGRILYVNGWIDWNANDRWEEGVGTGEHIVDGFALRPPGRPPQGQPARRWEIIPAAPGRSVVSRNGACATFRQIFPVPTIGQDDLWARFRLDYRENAGRVDPRVGDDRRDWQSDPSLRPPELDGAALSPDAQVGLAYGATRFGEVEDYIIGMDYGDAPDPPYPTKHTSGGAHALSYHREWLGTGGARPQSTRERDACDPDAEDQDPTPNLQRDCSDENRDDLDRGAVVPPEVQPGTESSVEITVGSQIDIRGFSNRAPAGDASSAGIMTLKENCTQGAIDPAAAATPSLHRDLGRYAAWDPEKRLYLNAWADWNGDGDWDDANENVVNDQAVDPEDFGKDAEYTLGEPFDDQDADGVFTPRVDNWLPGRDDVAGVPARTITCKVDVPRDVVLDQTYYWRVRLGYGEGATPDDEVIRNAVPVEGENRNLAGPKGGSFWGEVEDHPQRATCVENDEYDESGGQFIIQGPQGAELVELRGPSRMRFDICDASDPDRDGLDSINGELVRLELSGAGERYGEVRMGLLGEADPEFRSLGTIEETANARAGAFDVPPFAPSGSGVSVFGLHAGFEIGGTRYRASEEITIETPIGFKPPQQETYRTAGPIALVDSDGNPVEMTIERFRYAPIGEALSGRR
ncbi:MAG: S8/S53 family peptidase [Gammaproteobacteria bacterium]